MSLNVVVEDRPEEVFRAAAEELVSVARAGGALALSGGSAPPAAFKLAAAAEPDWSRARESSRGNRFPERTTPPSKGIVEKESIRGSPSTSIGSSHPSSESTAPRPSSSSVCDPRPGGTR